MHKGRNGTITSKIEAVFEIIASSYVIVVVLFLWDRPTLSFLALTLGIGLQLTFWKDRLDICVMVIAALLGPPSEVVCVKSGLWSYHAPGLVYGVPVWLPMVWAYLINLFRRISLTGYDVFLNVFPNGEDNGWFKRLFLILTFFVIVYFIATILLIAKTFAIIFAVFMILVVIYRNSRQDVLLFIVGAILGTVGEAICMKLGFWNYHNPRLKDIGLPMSLPLAWGLSSVIIVCLAEKVSSLFERKPDHG